MEEELEVMSKPPLLDQTSTASAYEFSEGTLPDAFYQTEGTSTTVSNEGVNETPGK